MRSSDGQAAGPQSGGAVVHGAERSRSKAVKPSRAPASQIPPCRLKLITPPWPVSRLPKPSRARPGRGSDRSRRQRKRASARAVATAP